jgi:putative CocE/NonD family hydrolase
MSDGVRLAVDIRLPSGPDSSTRWPTIVQFTPYWRGWEGSGTAQQVEWVRNGYAVLVADVRGTGASFGTWNMPWSPREVRDLTELVDWIARRPWSNGRIATIGGSYLGNTAQLAAVGGHSALRAVVPQYFDWDAYSEVVRFGGLPNTILAGIWGEYRRQFNANIPRRHVISPDSAPPRGVTPVDGDSGAALLAAAVRDHALGHPFGPSLMKAEFRDDRIAEWGGLPMDGWLTHMQASALRRSRVPIFGWVGWYDAATAIGAINRFLTLTEVPQKVVFGPWNHGGSYHTSPYRPATYPTEPSPPEQSREVLCFFERHLGPGNPKPRAHPPEREIIYYTLGEERWHRTTVWPPAGTRTSRWYLASAGGLATVRSASGSGRDDYRVDFSAGTGKTSRWYTPVTGGDVIYPDRKQQDEKLLIYQSAPLERDVLVTGEPVVTLTIRSTHPDGAVIVYLEDVDPSGEIRYLTEGALRLINRAESKGPYVTLAPYHSFRRGDARPLVPGQPALIRFGLIPTSVRLQAGHRIRIAIAGADQDVYQRLPADGTPTLTVERGGRSFIELPVSHP